MNRRSTSSSKPPSLVSTARVRLPSGPHTAVLDDMGLVWGRLERALHAELVGMARASGRAATSEEMNALKVRFIETHDLTSRHYNSVLFGLKGAYASRVTCLALDLANIEAKMAERVSKRDTWAKKLDGHAKAEAGITERAASCKAPTKAQRKALLSDVDLAAGREAVFRHARVAHRLEQKAERLRKAIARPIPAMVFGGVKRLRGRGRLAQMEAGGVVDSKSLADWRKGWDASRSSEIFVMGSSDETLGNQSCAFIVDPVTGVGALRLRALTKETGYVVIPGVQLNDHARRVLAHWLASNQAPRTGKRGKTPKAPKISFRFVRTLEPEAGTDPSKTTSRFSKPNARFSPWEVCITVEEVVPVVAPFAESEGLVLGVDVNGDHLACALSTADGNPVASRYEITSTGAVRMRATGSGSGFWTIPMHIAGLDAHQRAAVMGDAVKAVVALAVAHGARLAIEKLDFGRRKHEMMLTPGSARRNRALSAFPYAALHALLTRAAARAGVAIKEVNPAYTSVVGRVKVAPTRGVSTHQGAALTIARRALGHTERYTKRHAYGSDGTALLAAEQAQGTSWTVWGKIHRLLRRHDAQAWSRRGERRAERSKGNHASHPIGGGANTWFGGDGIPDFQVPAPTGLHAEQLFAADMS
jgi:IS605 OrfB family transposase